MKISELKRFLRSIRMILRLFGAKHETVHIFFKLGCIWRFSDSSNTMTVTLVGRTMYRTFRCVWMLEELNIPYYQVLAHPKSRLARPHHDLGKIPVLYDDDVRISESAAINTYLGDRYGSPGDDGALVPPTPRPLYEQTVSAILTELDAQGLWIHRKHHALGQYFGRNPGAVKEAKRNFDANNNILAKQLVGENYILGESFSAADILWVHCLDWAETIGWDNSWVEESCTDRLKRYLDRCRSRPAYCRTVLKRQKESKEESQRQEKSKSSKL